MSYLFTLIHRCHICVADDQNVPIEDVHLDAMNADKSFHITHKCNSVYLQKKKNNHALYNMLGKRFPAQTQLTCAWAYVNSQMKFDEPRCFESMSQEYWMKND